MPVATENAAVAAANERLTREGHAIPVPPPLPESVITATSQRYLAVYELLTGKALDLKAFQ